MFYCVMKRIQQFAANLLSYIPTKYYYKKAQLTQGLRATAVRVYTAILDF